MAVQGLKNENAPSAGTESVDFIECGYLHYSRVTPAKRRLHSHIYTHTIRYGTLHTTGICRWGGGGHAGTPCIAHCTLTTLYTVRACCTVCNTHAEQYYEAIAEWCLKFMECW